MDKTDRKAAKQAALEAAQKAVEALAAANVDEDDEDIDLGVIARGEAVSALRGMVEAFGPRPKTPAGPRATLEKAAPADVAAYFASTGLTRKDLAAAAGVTTSVIATVQNEKGDRWSTTTFEAKKALIGKWMEDHADELAARAANLKAEADAKAAAEAARAAKRAARSQVASAKPAKPAAKATAKAGRPSPARRADNRKRVKVA